MAESLNSTCPSSEKSQEPPPEVPRFPFGRIEGQGVELEIVISVQPISSRPLPNDSPWRTSKHFEPESPKPFEHFTIFHENPLFDLIVVLPQQDYSAFDQPKIPFRASQVASRPVISKQNDIQF